MAEHETTGEGRRLTEAEVSRVLERAADLDARPGSLSRAELVSIAAEAGLDPAATEAAIREIVEGEEGPPPAVHAGLSPMGLTGAGGLGAGLGALAAAVPAAGIPAVGAALVASLYWVLRGREHGDGLPTAVLNTVAWWGFFAGAAAVAGRTFLEVMGLALVLWVVTTVVGVWRAPDDAPRALPPPDATGDRRDD